MRTLFLSGWFPYPPTNGSKVRIFNLLRELSRHHEVTLVSFADQADVDTAAPALAALCRSVEVVRATPPRPRTCAGRLALLASQPRSVVETFSPAMAHCIVQQLASGRHDLIVASQMTMAAYARWFGSTPAVFEEVELGLLAQSLRDARSAWRRCRQALTWFKHRHYLARLLRRFRACTVVSECERQLLVRSVPRHPPITIVPNAIRLADYDGVDQASRPNQLIFTGSFRYAPNHDAMCWFVREVYPLIRVRVPDAQLLITGDAANRPFPRAPGVMQMGHVEDVRPLVAGSWISVAPLRTGGGTRVKILEAMALGTPVVATSKGAEGLEIVDGEHALIADDPHRFAGCVVRLLGDPGLRERLSQRARELVARRYAWHVIGPLFVQLAIDSARPGSAP